MKTSTTELLNFLNDYSKAVARDRRQAKKERAIKKANLLANGTVFEIEKLQIDDHKSKRIFNRLHDVATVSDPETATALFNRYREIGHKLNLSSLRLYVDGVKFHTVNFTY